MIASHAHGRNDHCLNGTATVNNMHNHLLVWIYTLHRQWLVILNLRRVLLIDWLLLRLLVLHLNIRRWLHHWLTLD